MAQHRRRAKGWATVLAAIVGVALPGPEAPLALALDRSLEQYTRQSWSLAEGLPQSSVTGIVQGDDRFLYVATFGGLLRFDGLRFEPIPDSGGCGNRFSTLARTTDGTIWVGSARAGICRVERAGLREALVPIEDALSTRIQKVGGLTAHPDGGLWVGTNTGLFSLHGNELRPFGTAQGLPSAFVTGLEPDREGGLWVLTVNGICRLENDRCRVPGWAKELAGQRITALAETTAGEIWIGAEQQLYRRRGAVVEAVALPAGAGNVTDLLEDRDGNLWIGNSISGLGRLLPERAFAGSGGALVGNAKSLFEDHEGNLWVGFAGRGMTRLADGAAYALRLPEGARNRSALAMAEGRDGALWISVPCDGAFHLDPFGAPAVPLPMPPDTGCVWSLLPETDGTLWIGTFGDGLMRYTPGGAALPRAGPDTREGLVRALARDPGTGDLLVGTDQGVFRHGEAPGDFRLVPGTGSLDVHFLTTAPDGALWIGSRSGAHRILGRDRRALTRADGLGSDLVRAIKVDPDGVVWLGTYGGGLHRLADDQFTRYDEASGLPEGIVSLIVEDASQRFWMTGNRGVTRVERAQLEAFAGGSIDRMEARLFDARDGMPIAETNGGGQPSGVLRTNGELWVPTVDGVAIFDTRSPDRTLPPPAVRIERVLVDGRSLDPSGPLNLAADARNLEIHYTSPSFRTPERLRFRYRLEGYDARWNDADGRRVAYYPIIPAGDLEFRVSAARSDGAWSAEAAKLRLRMPPRFTQTPAFFLLLTSLAAALGALLVWQRGRAMARRQAELEEEVARRTAELARLAELTATINRAVKLDDVVREVFSQLEGVVPFDRIELALLAEDRNTVRARWSSEPGGQSGAQSAGQSGEGDQSRSDLPLPDRLLRTILESGTPQIIDDLEREARTAEGPGASPAAEAGSLRGVIACPLRAPGQDVGFLVLASRSVGVYTPVHQRFLGQLAGQLSLVVGKSELYENLLRAKKALEASNAKLEHLAAVDGLTGVANRRAFDQRLASEFGRLARSKAPLSVLMVDVDRFKAYNDRYGHQTGDHCLRTIARTLAESLRREVELVARVGGEEFGVILAEADEHAARETAERLRHRIERLGIPHRARAETPVVTVSIGLTTCQPVRDLTIRSVLEGADQALYRAKSEGRNRVVSQHREAPA